MAESKESLANEELALAYSVAAATATYCGVLDKKGRHSGRWVARHFVLRGDVKGGGGLLLYYRNKTDSAPSGTIALNTESSVIPKHNGDRHGFIIISQDREHLLYASSKKGSSQWISALESAARGSGAPSRKSSRMSNGGAAPRIREPKTRRARKLDSIYEVHEELGSGGFATVRRGVNKETGEIVALKIIPKQTYRKAKVRTDEEVMVLAACDHENVMRMHEVVHTEDNLVMVLELLTGGELFDRIVAREKYTENDAKTVAISILEAVSYLHSNGIVHRDLKPENLIFDRPGEEATLKMTDFGFATIMEPNKKLKSACGTPEYVAPEVLADKPYDQSADIWSTGVIIYILLCGYPPFFGKNERELFERILQRKFEFHHRFWYKISPEAKDLINKMVELNPLKRLTAKQALQHPWIRAEIEQGDENMADALIQLKRFNAARKFKRGVLAVMAANRLTEIGGV